METSSFVLSRDKLSVCPCYWGDNPAGISHKYFYWHFQLLPSQGPVNGISGGLVISALNHNCESDSSRVGLCPVCLKVGRNELTLQMFWWAGVKWIKKGCCPPQKSWVGHGKLLHTFSEEETDTQTQSGSVKQTYLVIYDVSMGSPLFQTEHTVQAQKTKQTGWPPWHTVHEVSLVFSSLLTGSFYTDSKSAPHLWARVTRLHPL